MRLPSCQAEVIRVGAEGQAPKDYRHWTHALPQGRFKTFQERLQVSRFVVRILLILTVKAGKTLPQSSERRRQLPRHKGALEVVRSPSRPHSVCHIPVYFGTSTVLSLSITAKIMRHVMPCPLELLDAPHFCDCRAGYCDSRLPFGQFTTSHLPG